MRWINEISVFSLRSTLIIVQATVITVWIILEVILQIFQEIIFEIIMEIIV